MNSDLESFYIIQNWPFFEKSKIFFLQQLLVWVGCFLITAYFVYLVVLYNIYYIRSAISSI